MGGASGYFVISLDFELMYGLSELKNQDYYDYLPLKGLLRLADFYINISGTN
jgi:hypothetical protein